MIIDNFKKDLIKKISVLFTVVSGVAIIYILVYSLFLSAAGLTFANILTVIYTAAILAMSIMGIKAQNRIIAYGQLSACAFILILANLDTMRNPSCLVFFIIFLLLSREYGVGKIYFFSVAGLYFISAILSVTVFGNPASDLCSFVILFCLALATINLVTINREKKILRAASLGIDKAEELIGANKKIIAELQGQIKTINEIMGNNGK